MKGESAKAGWQRAAREAMHEATLDEADRRYGTREPVYNYRWEHVCAVYTLAMKLAKLTGADAEVVEAAVWLHDIRKDAGEEHHEAGAEYARAFLQDTDFPPEKIERVAQAIEDHSGLWLEDSLDNLESQLLWDADKLAKLGLTAAFHWMGMGFAKGQPVTTQDLIARGRDAEWQTKTVDSMSTEPARRAATARLEAFNRLWDTLESELAGEDLDA
jgi:uncharacterized protein